MAQFPSPYRESPGGEIAMKFKIQKSTLLEGLQTVQSVVGARPTLPVLSNVLVVAGEQGLTLTTTNLDVSIRNTVPADVSEAGATTLPVKRLFSIAKELPEGVIEAEMPEDGLMMSIRAGSSNFRLVGIKAEEFPNVPVPDDGIAYSIDRIDFADALRKTAYAASTEDSRPILNSVLLNFLDGKLTTVATDGRRLAMMEQEVEFPSENNHDIVLPTRVVTLLLSLVDGEGPLRIFVKGTQAMFEFGTTRLTCKLVDGVYPNFRQVVVSQCENRIAIPREDFLAALRRMMIFTSEKNNSIRLTFEDNLLSISANTPEIGEADDAIAVKYAGPKISAIFNPAFVVEPLRALTSDEVFMELNDANSPGLIKSDIPFLYVLMPLRV